MALRHVGTSESHLEKARMQISRPPPGSLMLWVWVRPFKPNFKPRLKGLGTHSGAIRKCPRTHGDSSPPHSPSPIATVTYMNCLSFSFEERILQLVFGGPSAHKTDVVTEAQKAWRLLTDKQDKNL